MQKGGARATEGVRKGRQVRKSPVGSGRYVIGKTQREGELLEEGLNPPKFEEAARITELKGLKTWVKSLTLTNSLFQPLECSQLQECQLDLLYTESHSRGSFRPGSIKGANRSIASHDCLRQLPVSWMLVDAHG